MASGRLIVIEGTDCSGKATQSQMLCEYLEKIGQKVVVFSYPMYHTPTGRIIGGPYLGKSYICEGWFPEGATNVDPKVASLYYAADRKYHAKLVQEKLDEGYIVLLDRYTYSSMGHQACKFKTKEERLEMFKFIEKLEFDLLELPRADAVILLYMPVDIAAQIRINRAEALDELESDNEYLRRAAETYLEMAKLFNFHVINCAKNKQIRTIEDIHKDVIKVFNEISAELENK